VIAGSLEAELHLGAEGRRSCAASSTTSSAKSPGSARSSPTPRSGSVPPKSVVKKATDQLREVELQAQTLRRRLGISE